MHTPGIGAIVDEQTERLFRIAIEKHYLKDTESGFPYAYRRFKDLYENMFPDTPKTEMPTRGQMYHFYRREYGQAERVMKRMSRVEYNKDGRPLIGTAGADVAGPGSRFEIDATIADIYLVSDNDRREDCGAPGHIPCDRCVQPDGGRVIHRISCPFLCCGHPGIGRGHDG